MYWGPLLPLISGTLFPSGFDSSQSSLSDRFPVAISLIRAHLASLKKHSPSHPCRSCADRGERLWLFLLFSTFHPPAPRVPLSIVSPCHPSSKKPRSCSRKTYWAAIVALLLTGETIFDYRPFPVASPLCSSSCFFLAFFFSLT